MIGIDLEDPIVLRRALEDLEVGQQLLDSPLRPLEVLPSGSTLEEAIEKLNKTIELVNASVTALNKSVKTV